MPSTTRNQRRRQPVRTPQVSSAPRRPPTPRLVEAPDYSRDYEFVRRDLLLITLLGGLLLAGMIVASFII